MKIKRMKGLIDFLFITIMEANCHILYTNTFGKRMNPMQKKQNYDENMGNNHTQELFTFVPLVGLEKEYHHMNASK